MKQKKTFSCRVVTNLMKPRVFICLAILMLENTTFQVDVLRRLKIKSATIFWTSRCLSGRRLSFLVRKTGLKPRVGQINTSCYGLVTDATLHYVPWRTLRQWTALTRYTLTSTKMNILKV